MYLSRIIVENYKLLEHVDIKVDKNTTIIVGKNNVGKEPPNKTDKSTRQKIVELRNNGYLLKEICVITKLSYPTVQKYAKG